MTQHDIFGALTAVRKRREQIVRHLDALDREEAELNIAERVLQKLETVGEQARRL